MNLWGLDANEVMKRLNAVRTNESTVQTVEDAEVVFARVAASVICEPGDVTWQRIGNSIGYPALLDAVIRSDSGASFAARIGGDVENAMVSYARWLPRVSATRVLDALEHAAKVGATLLTPEDFDWLPGLNDLGDTRPHVLWRRGSAKPWDVSIAVVGARASTRYGETVTGDLVEALVNRHVSIVSGGAYGIDATAHRASLQEGAPTFAFMAGGIDRLYPSGHSDLHRTMLQHGAIYAEVPCGTAPSKYRFLARNRLIAAATDACIVVEAGYRSGSLNTAGHAATLGRPLGAVPGLITSPASAGCHRLMREYDAVCISSAADALELVHLTEPQLDLQSDMDPLARQVLDVLGSRPISHTRVAAHAGVAVAEATRVLAGLQIEGLATRSVTGWART